MITKHKPYPEVKGSDVEWLGNVPAHWNVAMVKQNYAIQLGKMLQPRPNTHQDVETPYLKAQHVQWFHVRTTDTPKMWASQSEIAQFGVAAGDLLVCEGGEGGRCGILRQDMKGYIIQNALHRVRPRGQSRNDYLQYVMSFIAATGWFDALNDKATIAHFTREKFGALRVPIPPRPEQDTIVRYLDHANTRIRHYVRAKQKLIALLREQKQAVIHQAVTGQVDVRTGRPYPACKSSGVEWLGDVPAHWEVRRLKVLADNVVDQTAQRHEHEIALALENVESWSGRYADAGPETTFESQLKRFQIGDVLFGKLRPYLAKVTCPEKPGVCVGEFLVLRLRNGSMSAGFLRQVLGSKPVIDAVNASTFGAKMPRAEWQFIGNMKQPVPPLTEQTAIVAYLDKATADIDTAMARAHRQIELLQEYRTRLIADVVTGKLDVREAAAELPEEDGPGSAEESCTIEKEVTV